MSALALATVANAQANLPLLLEDVQDPSSPYFLHPNKSLALVLVSTLLNGSNYHRWSCAMKMSLLSRNKLKLVDGTIVMLDPDAPLYPFWEHCNTMVLSWLM